MSILYELQNPHGDLYTSVCSHLTAKLDFDTLLLENVLDP